MALFEWEKLGQTARDRGNSSNYVISGNCARKREGNELNNSVYLRVRTYVCMCVCVSKWCTGWFLIITNIFLCRNKFTPTVYTYRDVLIGTIISLHTFVSKWSSLICLLDVQFRNLESLSECKKITLCFLSHIYAEQLYSSKKGNQLRQGSWLIQKYIKLYNVQSLANNYPLGWSLLTPCQL